MANESYHGKRVLVVGAARSGIAVAEFLLARGAAVVLTDTRSEAALAASLERLKKRPWSAGELALELGGHDAGSFRRCDLVVVSPGVPLALPHFEESRRRGIPVIGEIELAYRHVKGRILGITGSNGKTTTTLLTAELLAAAGLQGRAAGNVGIPLISFAEMSRPEDIYATEISSFQLEGIRHFRPAVGAILNLTPDHLDRYPGFEQYGAAKERMFMNQEPTDFAVLNQDDERTRAMAERLRSLPVLFSRRSAPVRGAFLQGGRLVYRDGAGDRDLCAAEDIGLKGGHNLENVLASCAIALLAGADPGAFREVVRNFAGVEHRLEWVAEIGGVQYFNDSKATNVDAARTSLEAFPGSVLLIAGGRDKGGDFTTLRALVQQRVKHLILLGEAAGKIREALSDTVEISLAADLPGAVMLCNHIARPGDVVLLAPACASFDMFRNFEHRGQVFKAAVHSIALEPTRKKNVL